jgi:molybdopterin-guanine dinucleotide biosynthesis protein A
VTVRIGGIVLAGGRSSRFGRDKLAEPIDGRSLLDHAIRAVQAVASEVVVVAAPGAEPSVPDGVRIARDPVAFEGPLAGLAAGLADLDPAVDLVIVVAGDMPSIVPAVLSRLLEALEAPVDAATLEADGRSVPLPLAVRRAAGVAAARELLAAGERRLRALPHALRGEVIAEAVWRRDDPEGATLRDIDTPADLSAGP